MIQGRPTESRERKAGRPLSGASLGAALSLALFAAAVPGLVTSLWQLPDADAVARSGGRWHPVASTPAARSGTLRPLTGYLTARVKKATVIRVRPGGRPLARVSAHTEYRSPRVLGGLRERGDWVAVGAPELGNRRVGWVPASRVSLVRIPYSIRIDVSRRQLVLREGERVLRRMTVAVGRPGTPTPAGRYSVTDKLRVTDPRSPYGCCALALSARQPKLPVGWPGGDRVAIHATRDLASLGRAASFGCVRGRFGDLKYLMRAVPLGTPVFVTA